MQSRKKEIVAVLIKAGRKDLASVYAAQSTDPSDRAWESIAGAWMKSQASFVKVLNDSEKDAMSNSFMRTSYQKSYKKIRTALKTISDIIRDNSEAV